MRKGQVLIVVLLILAVVLTVAMSLASRSLTEVKVSTSDDETMRALEAAESGIERSLAGTINGGGLIVSETAPANNATYNVINNGVGGRVNDFYDVPFELSAGDVATVTLNGFSRPVPPNPPVPVVYGWSKQIRICWGVGSGTTPAIEAMLYFQDGSGNVGVGRAGFDPDAARISAENHFSGAIASGGSCPQGPAGAYKYYVDANLKNDLGIVNNGTPLFLRIRVLYNTVPERVAVVPLANAVLPVQGTDTISTGTSGESVQKLHAFQANPDLPMMFDAALFSGGDLIQ